MGKSYRGNDEYSKKWANKRKAVGHKKNKNKFGRQHTSEAEDSNITDLRQWNG